MSATKGTHIDGDLAVGMDATVGRNVLVNGSATVRHSLRIDGWLDAANIKSPCKGLFAAPDILINEYPAPRPGWWAMVGTKSPVAVFVEKDGKWEDSMESVTLPGNFDMPELSCSVEELQKALAETAERLGNLVTEHKELNNRVVEIDARLTEVGESLPERCPRSFSLDRIEALNSLSEELDVAAAFTAVGEVSPVLPRPGDRLVAGLNLRSERCLVVTKSERNRLVSPVGQSVSWRDGASETTVRISGFRKFIAKESILLSLDAVIDLETDFI